MYEAEKNEKNEKTKEFPRKKIRMTEKYTFFLPLLGEIFYILQQCIQVREAILFDIGQSSLAMSLTELDESSIR